MNIFWFIPLDFDGHYLGSETGKRAATLAYLRQIAAAADVLGYHGALVPTGNFCEDAWIAASALVPATERLRFLIAIRPGIQSPTAAARMAATFDRLSGGRLLINVATGGDPAEMRGDGVFLDHDDRYHAAGEFLSIWRRLMNGETVDFVGQHLKVEGAKLLFPPSRPPTLYFGGSSAVGHRIAAEHIDHYLTWGEPPAAVAQKISELRRLAAARGRTLRFGIRLHVIVRETEALAWAAADDLIRHIGEEQIAAAEKKFARFDSVGQQRMSKLLDGITRSKLEISPNLWAGIGLVRRGGSTALVGDPETVARRLREYAALGIESFIFSGYPHLEEAYRVAELLFPLLPLAERPAAHELDGAGGSVSVPVSERLMPEIQPAQ